MVFHLLIIIVAVSWCFSLPNYLADGSSNPGKHLKPARVFQAGYTLDFTPGSNLPQYEITHLRRNSSK